MKAQDVVVSMGSSVADPARSASFVAQLMRRGFDPQVAVASYDQAAFRSAASEIDKDRKLTSGQRCLLLFERLISARMLSPVKQNPGGAVKKTLAARSELGVSRSDLERVWWLVLDAVHGKPGASECVETLRRGEVSVAGAARVCWGTARGRRPEPKSVQRSYAPRRKFTKEERAWITDQAQKIRAKHETPAQRAIAMARATLDRGLASLDQFGGPCVSPEGGKLIGRALDIGPVEVRSALTVLRKVKAGTFPGEIIEAIESGRYRSCRTLLGGGKSSSIEVQKDEKWFDCLAQQMQENTALITPTQKVLAYYDTVIAARALDPTAQLSRQSKPVYAAATKWIVGLSLTEAQHCWTLVRSVARRELPASVLEGPRAGVITAGNTIGRSLTSLIRSYRESRRKKSVEAATPTERVKVYVSDVRTTVSDDPLEDATRFAETTCEALDEIISRADEIQDLELVGVLRGLREKAGAVNTRLTRMTNERVVQR